MPLSGYQIFYTLDNGTEYKFAGFYIEGFNPFKIKLETESKLIKIRARKAHDIDNKVLSLDQEEIDYQESLDYINTKLERISKDIEDPEKAEELKELTNLQEKLQMLNEAHTILLNEEKLLASDIRELKKSRRNKKIDEDLKSKVKKIKELKKKRIQDLKDKLQKIKDDEKKRKEEERKRKEEKPKKRKGKRKKPETETENEKKAKGDKKSNERKIGEVLEDIVKKPGKLKIPEKTMNEYLPNVVIGIDNGFDFPFYKDYGMGILRKFCVKAPKQEAKGKDNEILKGLIKKHFDAKF